MLQRQLDLTPTVECGSVYGALADIVQSLLISGYPAVDVTSARPKDQDDALAVFDRLHRILVQAHLLDGDAPIGERAGGVLRFRLANPHQITQDLPARIRIDGALEPAALLLHAFVVLRVRYQTAGGLAPIVRVEAPLAEDLSVDTLYLVGDAFTERYPVTAELSLKSTNLVLTLRGETQRISGGLNWARGDYIRSRDASLLVRPLREAAEGPDRVLVIPRQVVGSLGTVRARIPHQARLHVTGLRWLGSLLDLRHPAGGDAPSKPGTFGEHFSVTPANAGHLASTSSLGTDVILPVRSVPLSAQEQGTASAEKSDALPISMEALGGAREIGANSYYYKFGHRGLLIDAGFDANRDGWLGLPALEQITRLDAIILTHAHLDHVGAMPVVLAAFPKAPVYCTRATLAVLFPQLNDSAKVGQIRFEETGELPSFNRALADNLPLGRFRILPYGQRVPVPEIPGLSIQFADAGHIIGSAGAYLEFGDVSILHTGDISVEDQHLLHGMRTDERVAHHVIAEGTYCGEPKFSREQRRAATDEFLSSIKERLDAGGSVLIPAFSLGRAQELVGLLVDWMDRTKRSVPVWTVGLVNVLNDVSAAHPEFLPKMSGNPFARVNRFPSPSSKELTNEQRRDEYGRIFFEIAKKAPSIVIASHGMMAENTGSYLIGRAILTGNDPRHGICLCGYMDPRTPGFRLRHQVQEPVIDYGIGDPVTRTIPPERVSFFRLTAHASYEELMEVAVRIPTRSITFIHGEGEGLDRLRVDLLKRYEALGRQMPVRVPAIGERILLDRASYPSNWADEPFNTELEQDTLGPGRKFIKQSGLSVRGLTEDRRWALIRIGTTGAVLALEHDHITSSRIEAVQLRPQRGSAVMAYNRERAIGNLARIEWSEPGLVTWAIWARDPGNALVPSELRVFYGAELRPIRPNVSAGSAVLEVQIGGAGYAPQFQALTLGAQGSPIKTGPIEWDPAARILNIPLLECTKVGDLEDVYLSIRWPNGFNQNGPSLGTITVEPVVSLVAAPCKVGMRTQVVLQVVPAATGARAHGQVTSLRATGVEVLAKRPGRFPLELEFESINGGRDWKEVGTIYVTPAAKISLPASIFAGRPLRIAVEEICPHLHGQKCELLVGGERKSGWIADQNPHYWEGTTPDVETLQITVATDDGDLWLWDRRVTVANYLRLDKDASVAVTAVDSSLVAELTWITPGRLDRQGIQRAFEQAGFNIVEWRDNTLRLSGSERTRGSVTVAIRDGSEAVPVTIVTLPTLEMELLPKGPYQPGEQATLLVGGHPIDTALYADNGGPFTVEVDRIEPLFDVLSCRAHTDRVQFDYPGRYEVALVTSGRRLRTMSAVVVPNSTPAIAQAAARTELRAASLEDATVKAATLLPLASTCIFVQKKTGAIQVLQDHPDQVIADALNFVRGCLDASIKVLVTWPDLALSHVAGKVLSQIRTDHPSTTVAYLSYPAPRGELVESAPEARELRQHRILCSMRKNSLIDRDDAYPCPSCGDRLWLRTDHQDAWAECTVCGYQDRALLVTLRSVRSGDPTVLFADFRMAKYLTRGYGTRYAGGFARSVRCSACHRIQDVFSGPGPWDRAELVRLVGALTETWNGSDEAGSIRLAAYRAARRASKTRLWDISRHEDQLRRLAEAGILETDKQTTIMQRLEAGRSLCCEKSLMWSQHSIGVVFLNIEVLTDLSVVAANHPGLPSGPTGLREFLGLGG